MTSWKCHSALRQRFSSRDPTLEGKGRAPPPRLPGPWRGEVWPHKTRATLGEAEGGFAPSDS